MASSNVQDVRDRVLQLAREIEQLSQTAMPPDRFFEEFLGRLTQAVGAQAGAVWLVGGGRLDLRCDIRLANTGLMNSPTAQRQNEKLLANVINTGEASAHVPDGGAEIAAPTDHLVIMAALHCKKECVGVVEIFQRPDTPRESRPGYLQFLEQMCGFASRFLERSSQAADAPAAGQFSADLESYLLQIHRSLTLEEVAATAANDGRILLNCDRFSIALHRGRRTDIKAISGQDSVNARANLVRTMAALAQNVIKTREPLAYTGRVENLAPQIEKPLANYIQESGSRMVLVVPLFENSPVLKKDEDERDRKKDEQVDRKAFGCIIVEQVADSEPKPGLQEQAELVADHISEALFNAREHHRIFGLRLWKFLGRMIEWFHGRKLAKTLAITTAIAGIAAILTFVPWEYRVTGEGTLLPITQKQVFAPWDGRIVELRIEGGEHVEAGQVLAILENKELLSDLTAYETELNEKTKLLNSLQAQIDEEESAGDRSKLTELMGQREKTVVELEGVEAQIRILTERIDSLTVVAPISGRVATFQVEQRLENRPIQRGEVLVEIMDDEGQWHLELDLEEQRMGHVLGARETAFDETGSHDLRVEYRLATDPESTYVGQLSKLASRADKSADLGNVVEAFVTINKEDLPERRIGAEVRAKIDCGKRSLGYVLFGDVVEFVQKYLWL